MSAKSSYPLDVVEMVTPQEYKGMDYMDKLMFHSQLAMREYHYRNQAELDGIPFDATKSVFHTLKIVDP